MPPNTTASKLTSLKRHKLANCTSCFQEAYSTKLCNQGCQSQKLVFSLQFRQPCLLEQLRRQRRRHRDQLWRGRRPASKRWSPSRRRSTSTPATCWPPRREQLPPQLPALLTRHQIRLARRQSPREMPGCPVTAYRSGRGTKVHPTTSGNLERFL